MIWIPIRGKEGQWVREDGCEIHKVNPRGKVLYALIVPGERRPRWHDSLALARKDAP